MRKIQSGQAFENPETTAVDQRGKTNGRERILKQQRVRRNYGNYDGLGNPHVFRIENAETGLAGKASSDGVADASQIALL